MTSTTTAVTANEFLTVLATLETTVATTLGDMVTYETMDWDATPGATITVKLDPTTLTDEGCDVFIEGEATIDGTRHNIFVSQDLNSDGEPYDDLRVSLFMSEARIAYYQTPDPITAEMVANAPK